MSKDFASITTSVLDLPNSSFVFLTSALLHSELIADALRLKRCVVVVSVDAGTSNTYARIKFGQDTAWNIKKEDSFEVVWRTLGQYAQINRESGGEPSRLCAKYIFLDGNADSADVQGFFVRCVDSGVRCVGLALADEFAERTIPEDIIDAGALFIRCAAEHNLTLQFFVYGAQRDAIEKRFMTLGVGMPTVHPEENAHKKLERAISISEQARLNALCEIDAVEGMSDAAIEVVKTKLSQLLAERDSELATIRLKLLQADEALASAKNDRRTLEQKIDALGLGLHETQHAISNLKRSRTLKLVKYLSAKPDQHISDATDRIAQMFGGIDEIKASAMNAIVLQQDDSSREGARP